MTRKNTLDQYVDELNIFSTVKKKSTVVKKLALELGLYMRYGFLVPTYRFEISGK
jgi:hypothetical protein